jgi:hypothetical protein
MATPPINEPENYVTEKPNHMIFWLDVTIGDPSEYVHLKKAFGSNTDPRHETWTMLTDKDYDTILRKRDVVKVKFEGVRFLLQAFDNEADCLEAFEKNQDKRIFFITSGTMGKNVVPKIIERYPRIFTDLITDQPYSSIYVFCHNIEWNLEWAIEYIQYIQMFNFDSELLERMTRDIAEYFIERGGRIREANDLKGALQRLHWGKRLWHQYDKMQQKIATDNPRTTAESRREKEINEMIKEIEVLLPEKTFDKDSSNSEDDDKVGEACD